MGGILDILQSDIGKTLIKGTSKQLGNNKQQTASALTAALPLILGGMKNNLKKKSGASGLLGALDKKHDGGILDNLGGILGGQNIDKDVLSDGAGILGHVFGGKENNVARAVSSKSGMDLSSSMEILKVAAPVVMGLLGKQKRQQNVQDSGGMGNLLGGLLGSNAQNDQSMVEKILDADGDGSVIDDILGAVSGSKDKGSLSGLLGGFFGK